MQQRFEAGDVAQLEVLQAELELAKSLADYETTEQAQRAADVTLAALLNRNLEESFSLQGELDNVPPTPTLQGVTDRAMQSNGDLRKTAQDLRIETQIEPRIRRGSQTLTFGRQRNSPPDWVGAKGEFSGRCRL